MKPRSVPLTFVGNLENKGNLIAYEFAILSGVVRHRMDPEIAAELLGQWRGDPDGIRLRRDQALLVPVHTLLQLPI